MKKYVFFAFIALFFVSSSVWAYTAYVKLTAEDETVSWIPIEGTINGTNIEISRNAIDSNTTGSIDLNEVWSENDGKETHYQVTSIGEQAFYWCSGLTSITIGISVTSMGNWAFRGCKAHLDLLFYVEQPQKVCLDLLLSRICINFAHENACNYLIFSYFKVTNFSAILQEKRSLFLYYE